MADATSEAGPSLLISKLNLAPHFVYLSCEDGGHFFFKILCKHLSPKKRWTDIQTDGWTDKHLAFPCAPLREPSVIPVMK